MIRPEDVPNEMVVAAARVWNERTAKECNVDAGDQWRWYSEGFKNDARAAIAAAINASGCVLVKLDDGKLWSFLRNVLSQGGCIWADHQKSSAELYSARLDAAAAERATELRAMLAADPREQALDRMAENAQELGLYDEEKGDE